MKAGIFVALSVALIASCIPVCADDTPDQAAARAAMEQKIHELNRAEGLPSPNTNSRAGMAKPVGSANTTGAFTNAAASSPPAHAAFASKVPAENASAQAAALAALKRKMYELNQAEARPMPGSKSLAVVTTNLVFVGGTSAAATPVTETPKAEAPVAISPSTAHAMGTSLPATPAVVAPAPKISTAPAAAVAATPAAVPGPVAMPAITPPTAGPATPGLPASSPGPVRPDNELVTTTGVVYKNVEVERVTTDAIVISYTPAHGGWAMTKVYFRDLPAHIRQQYEKK